MGLFRLSPALLLMSCGSPVTTQCVLGPWFEAYGAPCANHPWCTSSPPTECAQADCKVVALRIFSPDAGHSQASVLFSETARSFSRGPPPLPLAWQVSGGELTIGVSRAPADCTPTTLLIGTAPYRAKYVRGSAEQASAIDIAIRTDQWANVRY